MARVRLPERLASLVAILLLALTVRLQPWGQNRFLEDEALYAYWGLQIATGADTMLDQEPVDKPPLHPHVLALSFALLLPPPLSQPSWAAAEAAARFPSLATSLLSIATTYALGCRLSGKTLGGVVSALLLALSPLDILFASTAFTDPLMTAWSMGALLAAAMGRLGLAGAFVGLAVATKQQGLLFLPLVLTIGILTARERQVSKAHWLLFALAFAVITGGALAWDLARVQRPGFLVQSVISYGGLPPVAPEALGRRAVDWLNLLGSFWFSAWFNVLVSGSILLWLVGGLAGWWPRWTGKDLTIAAFVVSSVMLHWLLRFQTWDRYVLSLVPLVALLAGRAFMAPQYALRPGVWRRSYLFGLALVLGVMLAGPVCHAARSELPLGGDHGAYDGIDRLAGYLREEVEPGSTVYHHWLGYHYRFYLYGATLRLHWYPDLTDLVKDAVVYRNEPRYIAYPSWRDNRATKIALEKAGITMTPVLETTRRDGTTSLRLYRLEGPPNGSS